MRRKENGVLGSRAGGDVLVGSSKTTVGKRSICLPDSISTEPRAPERVLQICLLAFRVFRVFHAHHVYRDPIGRLRIRSGRLDQFQWPTVALPAYSLR